MQEFVQFVCCKSYLNKCHHCNNVGVLDASRLNTLNWSTFILFLGNSIFAIAELSETPSGVFLQLSGFQLFKLPNICKLSCFF